MYRQFYKLNEEPFKLTPDPKFLYLSRSHEKALTLLLHGVRNREGFIVGPFQIRMFRPRYSNKG
jgi:general secretion pathway protein A